MRIKLLLSSSFVLVLIGLLTTMQSPRSQALIAKPILAESVTETSSQYLEVISQLGGGIRATALQNDYLYAGIGPRLFIMSVSSPNNPMAVGRTEALSGSILGVAVAGEYVYVVTDANTLHVIHTLDPANPVEVAVYKPTLSPYIVSNVAIVGDSAYLTGSTGLLVVDISNPVSPQEIGQYSTQEPLSEVVVSGSYAYVGGDTRVRIVDISNPATPAEVGAYSGPSTVSGLALAGDLIYVATLADGLRIVDISVPSNPTEAGYFAGSSLSGVVVVGNRAYIASTTFQAGSIFQALDISNPTMPVGLGFTEGIPWTQSITTADDYAYVATSNAFYSIRLVDWPYAVSKYGLDLVGTIDVFVSDSYAYMLGGSSSGLGIVDVSDPTVPTQIGSLETDGFLSGISVVGQYAYIADNSLGLRVVNVSDPTSPVEVGNSSVPTDARDVMVSGDYAYVADGVNGLWIIDVTNPTAPNAVGSYDTPGRARSIYVTESHAYIADSYSGLQVVDISDPQNPTGIGSYSIPGSTYDVAVAGSYAYVAADFGLRVVDISNPNAPVEVTVPTTTPVTDVSVKGEFAYGVGPRHLIVFDISDPAAPTVIANYEFPSFGSGDVFSDGSYIYVASEVDGLLVLNLRTSVSESISDIGGTLISASDNTTYHFPEGAFTDTVTVTHTLAKAPGTLLPNNLVDTNHNFEVEAIRHSDGQPASVTKPYTITVQYTETEIGTAEEATLALHYWNGSQWVEGPTSTVDTTNNMVTATPDHFSEWALAGTVPDHRAYLPVIVGPPLDLMLGAVEVTQAIQDGSNSVPLVADRPAVARVYAQVTGSTPVNDVHLSLSASQNGLPLPGSPIRVGPWAVFPDPSREAFQKSFNVPLPESWLSGQVTLDVEIDANHQILEPDEENNRASTTVTFNSVPPLDVKIVPVNYTTTGGITCLAPTTETDLVSDWIMRSFPISRINVSFRAPTSFTGDVLNMGEFGRLLLHVTDLKQADGAPDSQVYYGLVVAENSSGEHCSSGDISGLGWRGRRASVGLAFRSSSGEPSLDADRTGNTAAHEFGHNFDLPHAPCGGAGFPDPDYPYSNGSIGQYGFDVFRNWIWNPDHTADMMSYCHPQWFSDYNYRQLYDDQIVNGAALAAKEQTENLQIRITFDSSGIPTIQPIYTIPGTEVEKPSSSDYQVELLDAADNVITSHPVAIYKAEERDASTQAIYASIPVPKQTIAKLQLLHAGNVVAKRDLVEHRSERLAAPLELNQTDDELLLRWGTSSVPALIRYTVDEGHTWTTVGIDVLGGELQLDPSILPDGSGRFEVRLADSVVSEGGTISYPDRLSHD